MLARIINPFFAEMTLLDAIATRNVDPDGVGPLTGGYDDDFNEILVLTKGDGTRQSAQQTQPPFLLPCNIERDSWEALQQLMAGNSPQTKIRLVFSWSTLRSRGLIRSKTGECVVRVNDRMTAVRNRCGDIVYQPREPFYVTEVMPSFGLNQSPDLMIVTCEDRELFARGG